MEEGEECAGRGATRFSSARSEPYRSPSARPPRTDMTPTAALALSRHSAGHPVGAQKILSTLHSLSQSPSCTLSDGSGCILSAMKSRHHARGTCRRSTSVPWGTLQCGPSGVSTSSGYVLRVCRTGRGQYGTVAADTASTAKPFAVGLHTGAIGMH